MKRNLLISVAVLATMFLGSCKDDDPESNSIPEGTADAQINEDRTLVTSENVTNWTQYAVQVANLLTKDATTLKNAWVDDYKGLGN